MSLETVSLGDAIGEDGGVLQTGPFGSQLKQAEYSDEGVPVIMPKDIRNGEVVTETVARVSEATADRLARHRVAMNGIVLPRRGEVTKRAFIGEQQAGWLCGTGCIKIETKGLRVWPKYLYYLLGARRSIEWLERNAVGSTMLNLSSEIVARFPIRLPTIEIQEKIADTLSAYDDLIENNRRRIVLLEEATRLLYREWFVHFRFPGHEHVKITDGLPEGWESCKLGDMLAKVKRPGKVRKGDYLKEGSIPCVDQSESFIGGYTDQEDARIASPLPLVVFGDHTRVLKFVDFPFACGADGTQLLFPKDDRVSIQYFYFAVSNVDLSNYFYARHFKFLKDQNLLVPTARLVSQFTEFSKDALKQISALREASHYMTRGRDLLLPRLMNGEVAV